MFLNIKPAFMRKLYYVFILLSTTLALSLHSQSTQLPNVGFESWENVGSDTEEPLEWNSLKTGSLCGLCGTAPTCCRRESTPANVHSGTYSARIFTNSVFGNPANGVLTLGQVVAPSTTPSDGYNITRQANNAFNHYIGDTPDTIIFWAKYVPQDGTDSARMSYVIHGNYDVRDPQDAGSQPYVVAKGYRNFRTGGNWMRFAIPVNYTGPANTPNYIMITFTSSKVPGVGTSGTTLYLDDVSLFYNPVLTTGTINPTTYYVSSTQGSSISVPFTLVGTMNLGNTVTAQLSNSSGSFSSPVTLGSLNTTTSGTINGTIPAGTISGTGYRVRVISTNSPLTAADNGTNITINLVTSSISPSTTQTIPVNTNGSVLTPTETPGFTSREWKYSTAPGGPYISFIPAQTGATYTPNFVSVGTYYVVCETTYPGSAVSRSNEVQVNVVSNSIAPTNTQSLLISSPGSLLSVTETPSGTSREWKFANTSGGPYNSFAPNQTGLTYIPLFASAGTYYVVCESVISGASVISNEVIISVGSATLSTGTITGSPFLFSPNAPDANISVPFTVSDTLNPGNIFTAQLSDANGSFSSPVNIGTLNSTLNGVINANIPHLTPAGTGYRIRVISSSPALVGSDNGVDLIVDQFNNSISPSGTQNIPYNTSGTTLNVTESQSSSRVWKYSINSGGPYAPMPLETGVSYTPLFPMPGTYYVVCSSTNTYNDEVTSNEVQIDVTNGSTITTSPVITSGFYVSPNALVQVNVNFTSDVIFSSGNVFNAELSDENGSFSSPVVIGTRNGTGIGTISCTIPNNSVGGNGYRIRVTSTNPPVIGSDNGSDLSVIELQSNIVLPDTQYIVTMANGTTMNVISSHPNVTHEWKYRSGFGNYLSFSPQETGTSYTPYFTTTGTRQVTCFTVNQWNDTTQADEVMIFVSQNTSGIDDENLTTISTYYFNEHLYINLNNTHLIHPVLSIYQINGSLIFNNYLIHDQLNMIPFSTVQGIYIYTITDDTGQFYSGKLLINR